MPVNKKQFQRLVKLVAQLKENRGLNCTTFAKDLQDLDISKNINISCGRKTILRDIKLLKEEYGAPIEFDRQSNSYHLKHKGWDLKVPQLLSDSEMLAAVLGARLAEEIFPEPLRSDIRNAVDFQLTNNSPDFLDSAQINALIVVPRLIIEINPGIFMTVFRAWQNNEAVNITYEAADGSKSERMVEPHILAFYDQAWYIKGWCRLRNEIRSFAIHRILKAQAAGKFFEPDQELIKITGSGDFLQYDKVEDIEIICENELKTFLETKPFHESQKIQKFDNEHILLSIPAAPEHEIVKWVMYQSGKARLIKPPALIQIIHEKSRILTGMHPALS